MTRELDDLSDADLLARARADDTAAYGVLWKRHWNAARGMAASVTTRFEADDLASEAFARILKAVERGQGPKSGFRSYLATTVRNVAIDWSRRKSSPNLEDPDALEDWSYSEVTALDKIERETIAKAFYALPDSWQEVLWYTQVEDMSPRDVAPLLGLSPNAVSALAVRAREGLRQSWINAHLAEAGPGDPAHAWTIKRLGSHVRGRLSRADRSRVMRHLGECSSCAAAAGEADRVGSRLALSILPLVLGAGGAAAYTEWLHSPDAAVAAALPAPIPAPPGGPVKGVLASVGQHAGLGTAAATAVGAHPALGTVATSVMVAAVLTAGTVLGTAPRDEGSMPPAESTVAAPEPRADGEGAGPADPGEQADPAPETPLDVGDPVPEEVVEVTAADEEAAPAEPDGALAEPETETETETETVDVPRPKPAPGREAAIRSIPAADTVVAYRLDDGIGDSAVDFVHQQEARYDRSPDGATWSLCDGIRREATDVFTLQIWFKTTVGGGRLLGFSGSDHGVSAYYDRHLFLTDDGRLVFGVYPGAVRTIASGASYSDGRWHQATATLSPDGMALYVDGERVASDATVTQGYAYSGFWRIGSDNLDSWGPATPRQRAFAGDLEYAAVYSVALTPAQVHAQWIAGE